MDIKLKEIIWEITPKCNKNCDYCGSKNILDDEPMTTDELRNIAINIAKYGVEEVTLSGGEPATLGAEALSRVVRDLRGNNKEIKVKIVTNGLLFDRYGLSSKFDVIGLSVNTKKEISNLNLTKLSKSDIDKTTIITNFGNHNIFEYDELLNFVLDNGFGCWQIQLNQGKDQLNKQGIEYLYEKIEGSSGKNIHVLADNLQRQHECTAGIMSCGISYMGEVVGCISERAWNNGEFVTVYGGIGEDGDLSLKEIWENQFKDIRFGGCRKSCRDCLEYPDIQQIPKQESPINIFYAVQSDPINPWCPSKLPKYPNPNSPAMLYGISQPPQVVVYGAFPGNSYLYGVQGKMTTTTGCVDEDGDDL